jgi:hypothetical protein
LPSLWDAGLIHQEPAKFDARRFVDFLAGIVVLQERA